MVLSLSFFSDLNISSYCNPGDQCFCANSISTSTAASSGQIAPATDCSTNCPGSPYQTCGAGDRINIYEYSPPLPSGWSVLGCYTDSVSDRWVTFGLHSHVGSSHRMIRALQGFFAASSGNTPEDCVNICSGEGFSLAGVEYGTSYVFVSHLNIHSPSFPGQECYCANTITAATSPSTGQLVDMNECNKICSGNAGLLCGAGDRVLILATPVPSVWQLQQNYQGATFFDGWSFFSGADPTYGEMHHPNLPVKLFLTLSPMPGTVSYQTQSGAVRCSL